MGEERVVSVIVRTRNRPQLLKEALDSLARQTYPLIEVVVVNDGGEDVSPVLEQYSRRFYGLKYVHLDRNTGRASAANAGLKEATGDLIAFLDDDDLLLEKHFEILISHLESSREVVYSR